MSGSGIDLSRCSKERVVYTTLERNSTNYGGTYPQKRWRRRSSGQDLPWRSTVVVSLHSRPKKVECEKSLDCVAGPVNPTSNPCAPNAPQECSAVAALTICLRQLGCARYVDPGPRFEHPLALFNNREQATYTASERPESLLLRHGASLTQRRAQRDSKRLPLRDKTSSPTSSNAS